MKPWIVRLKPDRQHYAITCPCGERHQLTVVDERKAAKKEKKPTISFAALGLGAPGQM